MIKAVLFDLGGTLHVSMPAEGREVWFARRVIDRLHDYGLELRTTPEELSERLRINAEAYKRLTESNLREYPPAQVWSRWFLRDWGLTEGELAPMAEELSFLYDYERPRIMRRPHLEETLEVLRGMGLRLGVISNIISLSVVPHFLKEYGIDGYMDCVITSSSAGIRKPSPEIFRLAERTLELEPEELAYVGDTISRDVRGVRNAGWRLMIQIKNPGAAHRDKGLENGPWKPDYLIGDLAEIPDIIQRENEKER